MGSTDKSLKTYDKKSFSHLVCPICNNSLNALYRDNWSYLICNISEKHYRVSFKNDKISSEIIFLEKENFNIYYKYNNGYMSIFFKLPCDPYNESVEIKNYYISPFSPTFVDDIKKLLLLI